MTWFAGFMAVLFIVVCILLIGIVLLQKGRGGGLGAALGGAGQSAFGTKTGDMLTWVTIVLTAAFLLLAIGTSMAYRPDRGVVAPVTVRMDATVVQDVQPIDGRTAVNLRTDTQGATIHFAIGEEDVPVPTTNSPQPEDERVWVEPGQTLRARAWRAGWDPSPVTTVRFVERPRDTRQPADTRPVNELPGDEQPGDELPGDAGAPGDPEMLPAE